MGDKEAAAILVQTLFESNDSLRRLIDEKKSVSKSGRGGQISRALLQGHAVGNQQQPYNRDAVLTLVHFLDDCSRFPVKLTGYFLRLTCSGCRGSPVNAESG